jgi:hypothetical protein
MEAKYKYTHWIRDPQENTTPMAADHPIAFATIVMEPKYKVGDFVVCDNLYDPRFRGEIVKSEVIPESSYKALDGTTCHVKEFVRHTIRFVEVKEVSVCEYEIVGLSQEMPPNPGEAADLELSGKILEDARGWGKNE